MADLEVNDDNERFCHELLVKLKKTTEGLLAAHTAKGVWGTYGGLRRVCLDAEDIMCHGIRRSKASTDSEISFWQFIEGLKWLRPNLALVVHKVNQYSQFRTLGNVEMGRSWLRESVQDHTLMSQLDILISDENHLHNCYHDYAFLCQPDYVKAMRICFKAIELGKSALLSEINPHLILSGQTSKSNSKTSLLPGNRALRLPGINQPFSECSLDSGVSKGPDMGNKHAHLNVTYSNQLSSSNVSLTVDPSLGVSSLQHQKILSDPYFVPSLDSPRVLENLRGDPFSESIRTSHLASQLQNFELYNQSFVGTHSQSETTLEDSQSTDLTVDTVNSDFSYQSEYLPSIVVSSVHCSEINYIDLDENARTSVELLRFKDNDNLPRPHLALSVDPETTSPSSFESATIETEFHNSNPSLIIKSSDFSENREISKNVEITGVKFQSPGADSQEVIGHKVAQNQISDADNYARLHSVSFPMGLEYPIINVQRHRDSETPDPKKNSVVNIIDPSIESALNVNDIAVEPSLYVNISGNSNSALDDVINSPVSCQSVPSSSVSKTEIAIKILPETQQLPRNLSYPSVHSDKESLEKSNVVSLPSSEKQKPKIFTARSDPSISMSDPLLSNTLPPNLHYSYVENPSPGPYSPIRPWVDVDLYQESMSSPGSSPLTRSLSGALKSSGNVYIPQTPVQGTSDPNPATSSGNIHSSGVSKLPTSNHPPPPSTPSSRKLGHKRWVSDTSTIRVDQFHQADVSDQPSSSTSAISQNSIVRQQNGQARRRVQSQQDEASEFEPPSYQGTLTKPTEGQSLMSYLTSQDFNTCANLEKENAHFRICEALIEAFESMKFNRMLKRQETGKSKSSSGSSSDEEIQELRQRIRIRKREKMMAKGRPFPSLSDEQTDTATNSQTASSTVSSKNDFSSLSGDSETDEEEEDEGNIDLTMSSDSQGNLTAIRSSGLNLSMASLYSDAELQRSNQQIEKNSSYDESMNPGSAEFIAISLLRKFSEKHLPKASELKWLVSEGDAPQRLLPLPLSTPVSPDDAENADLSVNRTRLRGNLEWAPPRAQIIFSVHIPEKRAAVMNRQNFRCAGCGMKVDPAFMKRYRYCEYLGKYFCQCCHTGETSIIPGRVIEKWDFSRYPIANFSYTLLEKMWQEPLFHVDTINPTLYKRVRGLESIRESRQQLIHLHSLLAVCKRDSMLIKEMQKMPSHWISNDDAYSMDDFAQVRSGAMLNYLKSFTSLAVVHVSDCQLCQGLGFICGMCQDQQVIFPFQLENVIKCPVCQSCYHKDCFIPGKCPKCIRLEARRKIRQEPLSPDSPDSGENDETMGVSHNVKTNSSQL